MVRTHIVRKIITTFLTGLLALLPVRAAVADEPAVRYVQAGERDSVAMSPVYLHIDFPINGAKVIEDWKSNRVMLDSLRRLLGKGSGYEFVSLQDMVAEGTASPDGNLASNRRLALRRINSLRDYLIENFGLSAEDIAVGEAKVPWDEFRALISASDIKGSDRILEICTTGSDSSVVDTRYRMDALKRLEGGRIWRILASDIFPRLRSASLTATRLETFRVPVYVAVEETAAEPETIVYVEETDTVAVEQARGCDKSWRVSTNIIEWGMAVANLAGEWDFACHWSLGLSAHYSAWNYGKVVRKFRLFILRPEVRWWPGRDHKGFFMDAHVQFAYYNFALPNWKYRIQDKNGSHPAPGGGIGIGYRLPVDRNGHWSLEAAVGCGVYSLKYDRFENRRNGPRVDSKQRTWFGIDNAAVSVVYKF